MNGALPPSSNDSRLIWRAAISMIPLPTSVEPVKPILRMSGCVSRCSPTRLERLVVSTLNTPGGSPASSAIFAIASAGRRVGEDGLGVTVQPPARAGRILRRELGPGLALVAGAAAGARVWRHNPR